MTNRRVVQLSVTGVENTPSTQCNYIVTALCDDGSMWVLHDGPEPFWWQIPSIPAAPAKEHEDD